MNRSLTVRQRRPADTALPRHDRADPSGTAEVVIARQRAEATARAIAALPDDQRAVFVLYQMEGLSYAEVGAVLRLPEPTIRGRLVRARRGLLEQMREWA